MKAGIIIVTGACGAGKSTVSKILAENSLCEKAVHMHTDDFYGYIRKGYIAPWLDESGDQNETVIQAVAAGAARYAADGFEVYVDGVIGPWFLEPWRKLAAEGFEVSYVVLRPDEESTVLRAANREQRESFPLVSGDVRKVWKFFAELNEYEENAVDTTGQIPEESAELIQRLLREGRVRLQV